MRRRSLSERCRAVGDGEVPLPGLPADHGGPYVPAVIFPMAAFRFTQGQVQHFATPSEKGGHNLRGFCPKCGSRITGAEDPQRGIIGVLASSLDDPTLFVPSCDLYVTDAQPWDIMSLETKKFPKRMSTS